MFKRQIAEKLVERIQLVTKANGYSQDVVTVEFDKVKLNIQDYSDYELPAVQLVDLSKTYQHEMSRSKSTWFVAIEICMRTTEQIGEADQGALWTLQEDVMRSIMAQPQLGLSFVIHVRMIDEATDLHMIEPNYVGTIGLEILYYEPITRENC